MFRLPTSTLQELRDRLQSRGARPSMLLATPADRGLAEAVAVVDEQHATALLDKLHQQAR